MPDKALLLGINDYKNVNSLRGCVHDVENMRRLLTEVCGFESHIWGTVVAYEGLRELENAGFTAPRTRNFFTVGTALSIFLVKQRLRRANRDGGRPALVHRWVNLNTHRDPVGGHLKGQPYPVDREFLDLPNLGCGIFDASCPTDPTSSRAMPRSIATSLPPSSISPDLSCPAR